MKNFALLAIAIAIAPAASAQVVLNGLTGTLGPFTVGAGGCLSTQTTVAGATTSMTVSVSPTQPANLTQGIYEYAWVSAANTVTVNVCNPVAGVIGGSAYNVNVLTGAAGGGGTRTEPLYNRNAAAMVNGVGAAVWPCQANCGVPDVSAFAGTADNAVLNFTSVGASANDQDMFIVPAGYNNQQITVQILYFTNGDTNTGHSGTATLTYSCGAEGVNPTFLTGTTITLPGIATSTQFAPATGTFTPSTCASTPAAPVYMTIKTVWGQGSLTYLAARARALVSTF